MKIIPACLLGSLLFITTSCDWVKSKTKETINKGGETVGKSATEFVVGVSDGVKETLRCDVALSQELTNNGIAMTKHDVAYDGGERHMYVVTLYLILNQPFDASLQATAYDSDRREIGRSTMKVQQKAGDAGYFEFTFDKRSDIGAKSKIEIGIADHPVD